MSGTSFLGGGFWGPRVVVGYGERELLRYKCRIHVKQWLVHDKIDSLCGSCSPRITCKTGRILLIDLNSAMLDQRGPVIHEISKIGI